MFTVTAGDAVTHFHDEFSAEEFATFLRKAGHNPVIGFTMALPRPRYCVSFPF